MSIRLYELAAQYKQLESLEASDDLPAEVIRDTLDALEGDIQEKSTNVAYFIANLRAASDAIKSAADSMYDRANRLSHRADALHAYLQLQLQSCGISKIECPHFTLQLKNNPPTVVIDHEGSVPDHYWIQPEAPPKRIDKKAIAHAIKNGIDVPGAHVESAQRMEIKS